MALNYPGYTVPQPTNLTLLDVLDQWEKGVARGRGEKNEQEAKQALGQYVESLYDPTNIKGAYRSGAAMNPGQGEIRPGGLPPGGYGTLESLLGVVNGSHDAVDLARDPETAAALEARYGQQQPAPVTRVASADPNDPAMSSYIASARAAESGGNPNARNPNSSATGLYQFTDPTWATLMQSNPELGLTPDGRNDPAQQEVAMRAFTTGNARALGQAGIAVNPTSLYASHFLGAGGATRVLQASPDTPMTALVSPEVIQANPTLADMTQGDFVQWASAKGRGGHGGYAAPRAGADGSFASPMRQVALPPKEVLMALVQNPATREFGASLIQQAQRGATTADQFQTMTMPDGSLAQVNISTGEMKLLRDASKADSWRPLTDPAERSAMGIPEDDKGVYQVDQNGQLKGVGGGGVNVSIGGEKAYDQALNKSLADTFIETQKGSANALKTITTLDAMTAALEDPNFYSGFGAEPALAVKRVVASLGLDPSAATSMETFNALAKQSALDLMGGSLGAGFSNADRSFVVEQTAGIGATKEGNKTLIDLQRKLAQRQIEIGKLANQYASEHDGRLDSNWGSYLAEWAEANPLFPQASGAGGNAGGTTLPDPFGIR
jgi:hypothetical protein